MFVIKRNGEKEQVKLEKITKRIQRHCKDLKNVDTIAIAQKVIQGLYDGVSTKELDELAVETAYSMSVKHPDYDKLATRLVISSLHKDTPSTFSEAIEMLMSVKDGNGADKSVIDKSVYKFIKKNSHILDVKIDHNRDFDFDYFGYKTLARSYLLKVNGKIVERPQFMWMRVACGIHKGDIESVLNTYELLSTRQATHATPTLFNAGTIKNQLASCYLVAMKDDSVSGIYDTLKEVSLISQSAGGIGVHIHNVRSKNSPIYGTGGISNGIIPMLKVFNETARYIDQGGGKRKGSFAIYLEPWHSDIEDFLDLRKNNGKEELRARDLNLAIWAPDLFFKKVKEENADWYLMDPNTSKGLSEVYGEDFEKLYNIYVEQGKYTKKIKARDLWAKIVEAQLETGQPYILSKDNANKKSNQKNIGTIKSSNLCCEIMEYSDSTETAMCNLSSISLPSCVEGKKGKRTFNFDKLAQITKQLVFNLNKVIDVSYYPVETGKKSNMRHRPIGVGIQGLADVFALLRHSWESDEAKQLNRDIAECMYFAGLTASTDIAEKEGAYETFKGSPASEGILQFDMWNVQPSSKYDWNGLKEKIKINGLRNSLLFAPMPTASTSQILGNTECFEPISSNVYKRATLSGEFIQVNKYLVEDLMELNLWNDEMRQKIIASDGSIQNIAEIPVEIKKLYKTVWELSQRILIDMSADRGAFTCQSQSLNLYFKDANAAKLTSAYFYGWEKGLKTIVYYTRTQAAREAIKFTVDKNIENQVKEQEKTTEEALICSLDNPEACEMCSS